MNWPRGTMMRMSALPSVLRSFAPRSCYLGQIPQKLQDESIICPRYGLRFVGQANCAGDITRKDFGEMQRIPSTSLPGETPGSLLMWLREHAGDNREDLDRLHRNLVQAIQNELTPRQRKLLQMYYSEGLSMTEISVELGVNKSTVSRTLARAQQNLKHVLKYSI